MTLLVNCLSVLIIPLGISYYTNYTKTFKREMEQSLKRNLVLRPITGCQVQSHSSFKQSFLLSNASVAVAAVFPTVKEIQDFQRTPDTLEAANKDLHRLAIKTGGYTLTWQHSNETRWVIPSDHPGQDRIKFMNLAAEISNGRVLQLYQDYKTDLQSASYLIKARHAVVHPSGSVGMGCGYYIGVDGCETRWNRAQGWWRLCSQSLTKHNLPWSYPTSKSQLATYRSVLKNCTMSSDINPPQYYKKVFVATALWDYNYNHFLTDSLARLIRHIKYLRANPDIMIHIRRYEDYDDVIRDAKFKSVAQRMRNKLFALLGIDSTRIVSGIIVADQVLIPRNTHCAYALKNPFEIRSVYHE